MSKPPRPDTTSDPLVSLFKSIGLTQAKAQEAAKSPKGAAILKDIIESYHTVSSGELNGKQAGLIVALSGALAKASIDPTERDYLIATILDNKLKSVDQVTGEFFYVRSSSSLLITRKAAVKFVETHKTPIDEAEFNKECGVGALLKVVDKSTMPHLLSGVSITPEELNVRVTEYIQSNAVAGWVSLGAVISALRASPELRWANPLDVKNAVEKGFTEVFGAKEAAKPKGKVRSRDV